MNHFCRLATISLAVCATASITAAPVQVQWSGEIPAGATLTNPAISAGETWSVSYTIDNSILDTDPDPDSGRYEDPALTATIEFSGGYTSDVASAPGLHLVAIDGDSADVISGGGSGFSAVVRFEADTLDGDGFPADGVYNQGPSVGAPMFTFGNEDGIVFYFDTDVDGISLTLETIVIPGDGNGDGMVNGLDYIIWASNFGADPAPDPPGSPTNGDYDDDGKVDGLDYIVWSMNFDTADPNASAVPEPGGAVMVMLALLAVGTTRHRGTLAPPMRR